MLIVQNIIYLNYQQIQHLRRKYRIELGIDFTMKNTLAIIIIHVESLMLKIQNTHQLIIPDTSRILFFELRIEKI